jgi:hypothetical protein
MYRSLLYQFKPPLFHIAEVTPAWMRSNVDPAVTRTSTDLRPSDDSDLGIDSWSEPDDWGTNGRADDLSSSGPNSQYTGVDELDEGLLDGPPPDETESSTNVDHMSINDEGWDNVETGSVKADRRNYVIDPTQLPTPFVVPSDSNTTSQVNPPHKLPAGPALSTRMSTRSAHLLSHGRAQSVNVQQTSLQAGLAMRAAQNPYRHSTSLSEGDGEQSEVIHCLNRDAQPILGHRTKPSLGTLPASAFPTSQLASAASVSPTHTARDEPRARNISAATVRARQSDDDQLADSEETLNHGERRRLDSQGSLRPLHAL